MKIIVLILALSAGFANAGALHCVTHDRRVAVCPQSVCPPNCKVNGYQYPIAGGYWCSTDLGSRGCKDTYIFKLDEYPDRELILEAGNTCSGIEASTLNSRYIWRPRAQPNKFSLVHQTRANQNAPFQDIWVRRAKYTRGKITLDASEDRSELTRESCN